MFKKKRTIKFLSEQLFYPDHNETIQYSNQYICQKIYEYCEQNNIKVVGLEMNASITHKLHVRCTKKEFLELVKEFQTNTKYAITGVSIYNFK